MSLCWRRRTEHERHFRLRLARWPISTGSLWRCFGPLESKSKSGACQSRSRIRFPSTRIACIATTTPRPSRNSGAFFCRWMPSWPNSDRDSSVNPARYIFSGEASILRSPGFQAAGPRNDPDADTITREAYSHEVSSVGFWPGGGDVKDAAFYSYMAPEPRGFKEANVRPDAAHYEKQLGEFLLMYEDARQAASPSASLLEFCQSTYEAGASLGKWDRAALER